MLDWIFLFLTISLCLASRLLLSKQWNTSKKRQTPLPPGPRYSLILSPMFWLRRSLSGLESILRFLHTKYGPILTVRIISRPAIFVADRDLTHQALIQAGAAFADRRDDTEATRLLNSNRHNISSAPYGPLWRLLRRNLAAEILHPSRVRLFAPARRWVLSILVTNLKAKAETGDGVVVVMEGFQYAMFCLLVFMCFGERLDEKAIRDIEAIQRLLLSSFIKFNVFSFLPTITKLVFRERWNLLLAIRQKQEEIFIPLIRARKGRKQQPGDGDGEGEDDGHGSFVYSYVDSLLGLQHPEDGGRRLSEGEIVSLCSEFLNAGTDTTATALQWIMANLVKHQEMQAKLLEEIEGVVGSDVEEIKEDDLQKMPYLKAVIMEGLRRHPPAHFVLPHTVTEDLTLNGYLIPRGASVNFTVAEMGWDGKVWEEPMEFKPERFLAGGSGEGVDITGSREIKMMPFGVGRRMCPGLGLAMLHLEYFVANLVREFEWKAVDGEAVDLSENFEFTVVMKNPLRARILSRRTLESFHDTLKR
ncbi:cytochrome P450 89A2-like [Phoenix dactylifera]|uniref:Cytochrome P450 89A2-like n=1 Tax=Phoenix dactylifera TaxID=42345 RepID=A0A8B8ZBQ9_PHODC|nr:cytochrome P450 89A2-like [Phoenix dactylifera]